MAGTSGLIFERGLHMQDDSYVTLPRYPSRLARWRAEISYAVYDGCQALRAWWEKQFFQGSLFGAEGKYLRLRWWLPVALFLAVCYDMVCIMLAIGSDRIVNIGGGTDYLLVLSHIINLFS